MNKAQKLTTAGVMIAIGVVLSPFSIPVGIARCFPIQHMINVISAVVLGPVYAVAMAFATSVLRNILGTGTLLAFPGSMIGALLAGLTVKYSRGKILPVCIGEMIGTGILGALVAYPVAIHLMGREAAIFAFVIPFSVSAFGGAAIAFMLLTAFARTGILKRAGLNV